MVFSPPSIDLGRQPTFTKGPAQTFTLTKESRFSQEDISGLSIYPDRFKTFSNLSAFQGTSNCGFVLTASSPSCTLTLYFTPTLTGGPQGLTVYTSEYDLTRATARATGTGTKPCTKKHKKGSKGPIRYKKKCKGFPFFDPTEE